MSKGIDHILMHGEMFVGQDLTGYILTEKFDGIRVRWTGSEMLTRGGNKVNIPDHWAASLPGIPLDGEIFAGYGQLQIARDAA